MCTLLKNLQHTWKKSIDIDVQNIMITYRRPAFNVEYTPNLNLKM